MKSRDEAISACVLGDVLGWLHGVQREYSAVLHAKFDFPLSSFSFQWPRLVSALASEWMGSLQEERRAFYRVVVSLAALGACSAENAVECHSTVRKNYHREYGVLGMERK